MSRSLASLASRDRFVVCPSPHLHEHGDDDVVWRCCNSRWRLDIGVIVRTRAVAVPLVSSWAWYGRSCLRRIRSFGGGGCWTVSARVVAGIMDLDASCQWDEASRKVLWVSYCPYTSLSLAQAGDMVSSVAGLGHVTRRRLCTSACPSHRSFS